MSGHTEHDAADQIRRMMYEDERFNAVSGGTATRRADRKRGWTEAGFFSFEREGRLYWVTVDAVESPPADANAQAAEREAALVAQVEDYRDAALELSAAIVAAPWPLPTGLRIFALQVQERLSPATAPATGGAGE